jgi:NADPH:quinone reductase-like Zn-dependent oxidoreductase
LRAVRLHAAGGPEQIVCEEVARPEPQDGAALVRVHAAALTRDELEWPVDRLPAIPSYELAGVVEELGPGVDELTVGAEVFALTRFDRDGVAADYAAIPAALLAPKPRALSHVEAAAVPLPALSAWQGLFDHGGLVAGQRVLIHGAAGGVGQFATQLAREHGAYVIGTTSDVDRARELGADEAIDHSTTPFEEAIEPVDLVFDTVGGERLTRSPGVLRPGGRLVSVAEEGDHTFFVVEPNRDQLTEIGRLADLGRLTVAIDEVFGLDDARAAFERIAQPGKRGKVVLAP